MQQLLPRFSTALALGAAFAVATAACDSDRTTAPSDSVPSLDARVALQFTEGLDASLEDAVTRLAPSLDDELGPTTLRAHLGELSTYLAAGDTARARAALNRAGDVLARASQAPDAAAIAHVLDHTHALLGVRQTLVR